MRLETQILKTKQQKAYLALCVNEELAEVPLDAVKAQETALLRLQPLVQRNGIVAVHIDLGVHVKVDLLLLYELLDVHLAARLLSTELVAGEGGNSQALAFVLLVNLIQLGVVVLGQAAIASHIDNNGRVALVLL